MSAGIGVAVIGCGDMGTQHARAWASRPDARVVAVYDPDRARCQALAGAVGARPCASYQQAILQPGVGAVSVCTPVCHHARVGTFAASRGRHVLSEKPLALTLAQADRMIAAAREAGVWLSTSFQYRAFSRNLRYRRLVQEGAFGRPLFVRFADVREVRPKLAMHRRSMNGGPLVDMAGHYFDLMRWLTGSDPVQVYAQGHVFGQGKARLAGIPDLAIDAATVTVTMASGDVLQAFLNWGMPEEFPGQGEEQIIGPLQSATLMGGKVEVTRAGSRETWDDLPPDPPGPAARIDDLVQAIRTGRPPTVTGEDGRWALAVSLAALRSIKTGRALTLRAPAA